MKSKLKIIKDKIGNEYVVIDIDKDNVVREQELLIKYIDDYLTYNYLVECKFKRDGHSKYHITVLSAREYKKIELPSMEFEYFYKGIGTLDDLTYYIIVESPQLQEFRARLGLLPSDLHITLGFDERDRFTAPKNLDTLIINK